MWNRNDLPINNKNIDYLWCKSKYPATPWDLIDIPKNFSDSPYAGYSDHSMGIEIPLIAISRGATIIEKHFTLDRSDTTIRDHALSATPDEFKLLTNLGRNIYRNQVIGL
jgi:sialic acid synthase SpsE